MRRALCLLAQVRSRAHLALFGVCLGSVAGCANTTAECPVEAPHAEAFDAGALKTGPVKTDAAETTGAAAQTQFSEDRGAVAPADSDVHGLDAMLTTYEYPYPVRYFETHSQGQALRMAYMLVEPSSIAEAATVVLMHGKNFSGAYWAATAEVLSAAGFRVVIPDQIGFGKSSKPIEFQYTFQELARLTHLLLEELGIERSAIVGHSMGGMLATRYSLMFPETTSELVLVNPIGLEDWKTVVPYHSIDDWTAANLKTTPASVRQYMLHAYFDGAWNTAYDPLVTIQAGWSVGPDRELIARVSALHYDMIFTQPVVYEFANVKVPTLLVIGQRDRTAIGKAWVGDDVAATLGNYPELGRRAHQQITNSKLVELPGIGHVPQVEAFEAWQTALLGFLKGKK